MDYSGRRLYTVADSRQPMYCTYSTRPEGFMTSSVPSYSTPTPSLSHNACCPQSRMVQCCPAVSGDPFIANSRLMVLPPRIRRVFAGLDDDDDDVADPEDAYVSPTLNRPASQRVEHYIDDIINSPQMSEIESETRKIRRDAESVLQRLGESTKKKPVRLSSVYFPDLSYSSASSTYIPRPYTSALSSSYGSGSGDTDRLDRYDRHRDRTDRAASPDIDVSDDFYNRPKRYVSSYTTPVVYPSSRPLAHDPLAQVQSEINRKALYSENCRKITDSIRGGPKKSKKHYPEADSVKNNIAFRAQYKGLRDAATVGVTLSKKPNDYLMV